MSPLITEAVLAALGKGAEPVDVVDRLRDLVTTRSAIDEGSHTRALTSLLRTRGPAPTVRAGQRLTRCGSHPILDVLSESRDPVDLLHRFERLEPVLHLGNRTRFTLVTKGADITHLATNSDRLQLAESLFVAGAQIGLLQRIGCVGVTATLVGQRIWPPATASCGFGELSRRFDTRSNEQPTWSLRWRSAPSSPELRPSGSTAVDVRRMISDRPAHPWTLSRAASELHLSSRTLQRRLRAEGNRFACISNDARLDAAEALLVRTPLPIGVIAHLCGFFDHSHLIATFRRRRQTTPTESRRSAESATAVNRASGR